MTIDTWSPAGVWVTTTTALRAQDVLRLDVGDGLEAAPVVYAAATVPIVHEGEMRHHVRLDAASSFDSGAGPAALGRHAVVWQRTPVRLLDVSRAGCCLETQTAVPAGSAGRLQLDIDEQRVLDDIRVAWCRGVEGGGVYHVGVELLTSLRAGSGERSLRDLLAAVDGASRPGSMSRPDESAVPTRLPGEARACGTRPTRNRGDGPRTSAAPNDIARGPDSAD